MTYNKRNIKPFKGRLISLHIKGLKNNINQTGEITASTKEHILFNVNKDKVEVIYKYSQITNITEPEKA